MKVMILALSGFEMTEFRAFADGSGWAKPEGASEIEYDTAGFSREVRSASGEAVRVDRVLWRRGAGICCPVTVVVDDYDALAIPGGTGDSYQEEADRGETLMLIRAFRKAGKPVAGAHVGGTMEEIKYRQVQPSDNPTLKFLVQDGLKRNDLAIPGTAYFDPNLDDLCGYYLALPDKRNYFVAETPDGRVVGGCGLDDYEGLEECAELQKLYVASDYTRYGIGTKLVRMVEEEARRLGYKRIYLETHSNLQAALELYKKEGYQLIDPPASAIHETMDSFLIKEL